MITQMGLNELVRDLGLRKNKAEFLGSRLEEWNVLTSDVRISINGNMHKDFICFHEMMAKYAFGTTLQAIMESLCYKPEEWRVFIDTSKVNLKAIFLHI